MRAITPLVLLCFTSALLAVPEATKTETPVKTDDPPAAPADPAPVDAAAEAQAVEDAAAEDAVLASLDEANENLIKEREERKASIAAEREKAKDEAHETLTTIAGKTYNKVVITKVDDTGIRIRHEAGTARVKFPDAPEELQYRFGHDPDAANAALQEERAKEAERIRASIAGLRAEAAAKDPIKAAELKRTAARSGATRKPTSRPSSAPKPKPTGPRVSGDDPAIAAIQAKIDAIQAGMKSVEAVAASYEKKAIQAKQKALGTSRVGADGAVKNPGGNNINQGMMRQADRWSAKASKEHEKLRPARDLIAKYRAQIKKLKTGAK